MSSASSKFLKTLVLAATLLISGGAYCYGPEDIPPQAKEYEKYQQVFNQRTSDEDTFNALDFSGLPAEYDPKNQPVFELGYIEIPVDVAKVRKTTLSKQLEQGLIVEHGGKTYYRFFIHPDMEKSYRKSIKQYGLHKGEFLASPTASPRSLIVWWKNHPEYGIFGQKVSLLRKIGGVSRLNPTDKLERAYANNKAFEMIPSSAKKEYGFDFLREPLVIESPEKAYGNISRDYDVELSYPNGQPRYLPGFAIASRGPNGEPSILENLIKKSGQLPIDYLEKNVLKPLARATSYVSFQEGLVGEPHQQNVLFEFDENGNLTGNIKLLDLDAYKPDLELRHIRGKSDAPFQEVLRPFKYLKLSSGPHYYDESYNQYIRNDWCFLLDNMLSKSKLSEAHGTVKKQLLWNSMDKQLLTEATRHFGSDVVFGNLTEFHELNKTQLDKLYPHVDWAKPELTPIQVSRLLTKFPIPKVIYMEGNRGEAPFSTDAIVNRFKEKMHAAQTPQEMPQSVLRDEYIRLGYNYRTSTRKAPPEGTLYKLRDGSIEAFSPKGKLIGTAILEPESVTESSDGFYKSVSHPRQEPNRELLKKFYASRQGSSKNDPAIAIEGCVLNSLSETIAEPVVH